MFGLALILQGALQWLIGPPPEGRPTWLAWLLSKSTRIATLPPRLRVFAPFAASFVAIRAAALAEGSRPEGRARLLAILLQAALLAITFDAWRGVRTSTAFQRELEQAPLDDSGRPLAALDADRVEAEIGRLANATSESVVGPWAAYAAFDLAGAVSYAAVESLGGPMAGPGTDGPLAAMLDPRRQLVSVRRGRDAIAAAATLAARGRADLQAPDLEDLAMGADMPMPVTAMSVALDRRASWNGRSVGWQRPPPKLEDLSRARRLHLKSLALLAVTAAAVASLSELLHPPTHPAGSDH